MPNSTKRKARKGNDGTQTLLVINAGHQCWSNYTQWRGKKIEGMH